MGVGEEDVRKTKDFIGNMLKELLKEDIEFTVIGRVGKAEGVKIRPLRIYVEDTDNRRKLLKSSSTPKKVKKFEKIYISPDLTKKQLEDDRSCVIW